MHLRRTISASFVLCAMSVFVSAQRTSAKYSAPIPQATLIQIMRAEDERRWDDSLKSLLSSNDAAIQKRAALAAGRIGVEAAVPVLAEMVLTDKEAEVREMAAFALGEIESAGGAYALVTVLKDPNRPARARSVEALGKIAAALASATGNQTGAEKKEDERLDVIKAAIIEVLRFEDGRRSNPDRLAILLGLTAVLRARPDGAGPIVVKFLEYPDSSIVATALNTMARLRLKDANEKVRQLLKDGDPIVRANAARVIGAAEHKEAFDDLLAKALNDPDLRVRVSAIRALVSLKDQRAVEPLLNRGNELLQRSSSINELLEITTTLGRLQPNSSNEKAVTFIRQMHTLTRGEAVEVEVAFARMAPAIFVGESYGKDIFRSTVTWRQVSRRAQGLAALKDVLNGAATGSAGDNNLKMAKDELAATLQRPSAPRLAVSDVFQAYAGYKPANLDEMARKYLESPDVVIRSTAAEVIGGQAPSEANARALIDALPRALRDKDLDDAALAILGALAKQKSAASNDAIKTALNSQNHLIRRRAVALLKANGAGDFSDRIGTVQTGNKLIDYRRAIARFGKKVTVTVVTSKGPFTIEFLPEEAPLTIDNFIKLALRGYFNGQTIPRVVPNFVIQAGDPRGDQNGGPGYSIRCEINEMLFERASVGMALSGKDTGGSQWFVTHSPQPHLDGGYTVFGRVIRGMDVVDSIARGDAIRQVIVNER
jgi:cyclophilin family peptidyl-prolyl cis-trans isomerase/HEAT repeat protein